MTWSLCMPNISGLWGTASSNHHSSVSGEAGRSWEPGLWVGELGVSEDSGELEVWRDSAELGVSRVCMCSMLP